MGMVVYVVAGVVLAGFMVVSGFRLLVSAFRAGFLWFLAYVFLPFGALAFVIFHWEETRRPFITQLVTCGLLFVWLFAGPWGNDAKRYWRERTRDVPGEVVEPFWAPRRSPAPPAGFDPGDNPVIRRSVPSASRVPLAPEGEIRRVVPANSKTRLAPADQIRRSVPADSKTRLAPASEIRRSVPSERGPSY